MTTGISLPPKHQIVLAAFGTSLDPKAAYTRMQVRFQERFGQRIPMGFTSRVGEPKLKAILESIPADPDLVVVITPIFMLEGQVVSVTSWRRRGNANTALKRSASPARFFPMAGSTKWSGMRWRRA